MSTWDAIVVGGGHNGLAAASVLASTGRRTLVLEARDHVGGLCAGEIFHPGYRHTGVHHDTAFVRPWLVDALDLRRHGLQQRAQGPVFLPGRPGDRHPQGLLVSTDLDPARRDASNAELSPVGDADGYRSLLAFLASVRDVIGSILDAPAPGIGADAPLWPLASPALSVRRLGGPRMLELMRAMVLSAEDWLSEHVQNDLLRAGLALGPLIGTWMGPKSPQSAGMFLLHAALSGEEIVGGPARLVSVLEAAARHSGAEIRCGHPVDRILVERGIVKGVTVRGEIIDASLVISALDPRRTLLDLVAAAELPIPLEDEIRTVRTRATSAKLHLALSRAPRFSSREGMFERFRVAQHTEQIERAFDDAKHGRLPQRPPLDVRVPSLSDPSLAPAGHHVLSAHVFGVPYSPVGDWQGGEWSQQAREQLLDAVLAVLSQVDPDLSSAVVAAELLVPKELEVRYGVTGGQLMHGEHALDQLWVGRPGRTTSGHATSIRGLFLGSGGTHPMGGASGAPGALAARRATEGT